MTINDPNTTPTLLNSLAADGDHMYAPAYLAITETEVIFRSPDGREHRGVSNPNLLKLWTLLTSPDHGTPEFEVIDGINFLKGQARNMYMGRVMKFQIPAPWSDKTNKPGYFSIEIAADMLVPKVVVPTFTIFDETDEKEVEVSGFDEEDDEDDDEAWDDADFDG